MNLFLDTEWADAEGTQLVSLALISEDRRQVFYAERDPLPDNPQDFVRTIVYPLLNRGAAALSDVDFTRALRAFLSDIPTLHILFDYANDGALFRIALSGFGLTEMEITAAGCGPIPMVSTTLTQSDVLDRIRDDWFVAHAEAAARRHHARIDAEALCMAWQAANGKLAASWSPTWRRIQQFGSAGLYY